MNEPPAIFKKIIIDPEWKSIEVFQLLIILFSMLTTLFAAYFACFGEPESWGVYYFDMFMEICFIIDIVKNFFLMYTDPNDPSKKIKDFVKIAMHYAKGTFCFDAAAVLSWPIFLAAKASMPLEKASLFYLLRLLRISKIFVIMDLKKFT